MFGRFFGDLPGRVNFTRLSTERRGRARKAMEKYDLDALLCLIAENCRYLTIGPNHVFYRYVLYNEERLHSALNYLRPADYYRGNPETLLAERKRKLKAAALRRKEVNRQNGLTTINPWGIIFLRSIRPKTT